MWTRTIPCVFLLCLSAVAVLPAGDGGSDPGGKPVRLGSARYANVGRVFALAFSDDSRLLAGGAWDGSIRVWETATGKQRLVLDGHHGPVRALAFAHDGKALASAGAAPGVCLWDVPAGTLRTALEVGNGNDADVGFFPDGRHLAAVVGGTLYVWERTGKLLWSDGGKRAHTRLAIDDAQSVTSLYVKPPPQGLADPDSRLYVASRAVASGKELRARVLGPPHDRGGFVLGPGGLVIEHVPVAQYGRPEVLRCFHADRPGPGHRIEVAGQDVSALCVSPDGRMLAVTGDRFGSKSENPDKLIRVFEVASGQERCRFVSPDHGQISLAFSPDGRMLASGSLDVTVLLWDLTLGEGSRAWSPGEAELDRLWEDLKGDAAVAYRAQWRLAGAAKAAVPFLARRLPPVGAPDVKRVDALVRDVADERFETRRRAEAELTKLGELAEPALRAALPAARGLEARRRMEALLRRVDEFSPARLAQLRAIEALERMPGPAARALLRDLAAGYPAASMTRAAADSLRRLPHGD